jgi:hypothetical protein
MHHHLCNFHSNQVAEVIIRASSTHEVRLVLVIKLFHAYKNSGLKTCLLFISPPCSEFFKLLLFSSMTQTFVCHFPHLMKHFATVCARIFKLFCFHGVRDMEVEFWRVRYSSFFFLILELGGSEWSVSCSGYSLLLVCIG